MDYFRGKTHALCNWAQLSGGQYVTISKCICIFLPQLDTIGRTSGAPQKEM